MLVRCYTLLENIDHLQVRASAVSTDMQKVSDRALKLLGSANCLLDELGTIFNGDPTEPNIKPSVAGFADRFSSIQAAIFSASQGMNIFKDVHSFRARQDNLSKTHANSLKSLSANVETCLLNKPIHHYRELLKENHELEERCSSYDNGQQCGYQLEPLEHLRSKLAEIYISGSHAYKVEEINFEYQRTTEENNDLRMKNLIQQGKEIGQRLKQQEIQFEQKVNHQILDEYLRIQEKYLCDVTQLLEAFDKGIDSVKVLESAIENLTSIKKQLQPR